MDNPNDGFGAATYARRDCAYTLPGMGRKRTMVARRAVLIAAPLAGLFALGGRGFGQEFPTGPITFVVAFPPGGSIDLVMRAMAPKSGAARQADRHREPRRRRRQHCGRRRCQRAARRSHAAGAGQLARR
jgi:hypothetical protein